METDAVQDINTNTEPEGVFPEVTPEMSPEEAGHFRERLLLQANENLNWSFLLAGKCLHEIVQTGWLKQLNESMGFFLASRSISFGASTATKLMTIYRVLVIEKKIPPEKIVKIGDYEKAYLATNLIEHNLIDSEKAVEQAINLSRADLIATKKGVDTMDPVDRIFEHWLSMLSPKQHAIMQGLLAFACKNRQEVMSVCRRFIDTTALDNGQLATLTEKMKAVK